MQQGQVGDGPSHAFADLQGDIRGGIPEQHGELLPAVASRHVLVADAARDRVSHRLEDLVAGHVAEAVVEPLEVVDVDHQHADGIVRAPAMSEQPAELVEVAPVRQPGQRVGRCASLGSPVGIGAIQRRRGLDCGTGQDPPGRRWPGAFETPRQHDRADHPHLRLERPCQGIGEAVHRSSTGRYPLGDPGARLRDTARRPARGWRRRCIRAVRAIAFSDRGEEVPAPGPIQSSIAWRV